MEWTDILLTVAKSDADNAEAVATMIAEGGIYIEDYSDIEQQVAEIAHVDLIEQELLDKPRDRVIIHMYLEPGASPVETLALISARMEAAGIAYTVETEGVEQEDWQNGWRKYYHPLEIGKRLAVVPSWQEYDTDRVKLVLDPGLAFGTGGHETTSLCMEALDERVQGGERVLDIGTGSGILAIAALKLGAAVAEGVDIDPVAVRTAGENAALNGVQDKLTVLVGDLSDKASGKYDIITANIVANAILSLALSLIHICFYARCGARDTGYYEHLFDAWFRILVLPCPGAPELSDKDALDALVSCYKPVSYTHLDGLVLDLCAESS